MTEAPTPSHPTPAHPTLSHPTLARRRPGGVRLLAAVAVVATALLAAACSSGSSSSTTTTTTQAPTATTSGSSATTGAGSTGASADAITIQNFLFSPSSMTVAPGATVKVTNKDQVAHTLTSDNGKFNTGDIQPGSSATFTAPTQPGTYSYKCSIHTYMTGTLTVS